MSELWGEIEQFQDSTPTEFKGKPGLAILPSDVSAAESPGTSGVAAADHVHRGVGSLEVAGTYLRGEIEIIAGDDIDVTASTTDNSITIDLEDDITVDSVNASEIAAANMDITGILRVNEIRPETDSPAEEILLNGDVSVTGILRIDEIRPESNSPTGDILLDGPVTLGGDIAMGTNDITGAGSITATTFTDGTWSTTAGAFTGVASIATPTSITMAEDGWIGIGAGAERLIFDGTAGQLTVLGAHVVMGDAGRTYYEASGSTAGTESIYSAADGYLDILAGTGIRFGGNVVINDTFSLTLSATTAAGDGVILKGTDRFIHNFKHPTGGGAAPTGKNAFFGVNAGNFTMGSTAIVPNQGSYNVGVGDESLAKLTAGYYNFGCGTYALGELTAGYGNVGIGSDAGRFIADGVTANALSSESIFIGGSTKASANGITDEIVIGYGAIGKGSHTITLGHTTITNSYIRGNLTIGQGTAATDYTLTFDGETNDGVLTWMEDEDYFQFGDDVLLPDNEALKLGTGVDSSIYYNGTDLIFDASLVAPSDLVVTCGAAKTLELKTPVYRDDNVGASRVKPGGTAPSAGTYLDSAGNNTLVDCWNFAVNDYVTWVTELDHDYAEGTDILLHVHFQGDAAPTGTDYVAWTFYYSVTRDGAVMAPMTSIGTGDVVVDTQYQQEIGSTAAISGTDFKIGDQVSIRMVRVAAAGNAYAGVAKMKTAGIHYQVNTMGSRSLYAK